MKYLIVGKADSGKDELIDEIRKTNLVVAKPRTTRQDADQNEYVVVDETTADNCEKISVNEYDGCIDFLTKSAVEHADVISVSPSDIAMIANTFPDTCFHIVYVKLDDIVSPENTDETNTESPVFDKFEKLVASPKLITNNCRTIHTVTNDLSYNLMSRWAEYLQQYQLKFKRCNIIAATLLKNNVLKSNEPGTIVLYTQKENSSIPECNNQPVEIFVDFALSRSEFIGSLINEFLLLPEIPDLNTV